MLFTPISNLSFASFQTAMKPGSYSITTQKTKFSIKEFFSKCDQSFHGELHFLCSEWNVLSDQILLTPAPTILWHLRSIHIRLFFLIYLKKQVFYKSKRNTYLWLKWSYSSYLAKLIIWLTTKVITSKVIY